MYFCVIGTTEECFKAVCERARARTRVCVCVRARVMNCVLGIPNSRSVLTGALGVVLGRQSPPESRLASGTHYTAYSMQMLTSHNVMYLTSDVDIYGTLWPSRHLPNCPMESLVIMLMH
jgi:hypothetical protein